MKCFHLMVLIALVICVMDVSEGKVICTPNIMISYIITKDNPSAEIHVHKKEYLKTNELSIDGNRSYNFKIKWSANVWDVKNLDSVEYTITTTKNLTFESVWVRYENGSEGKYYIQPKINGNNYTWNLDLRNKVGAVINFRLGNEMTSDNPWVDLTINKTYVNGYTRLNVSLKPIKQIGYIYLEAKGDQVVNYTYPDGFRIGLSTNTTIKFVNYDPIPNETYDFSILVKNPSKIKVWMDKPGGWITESPSKCITLSVDELGNITVKANVPVRWEHHRILPQSVQSIEIRLSGNIPSIIKYSKKALNTNPSSKVKLYDENMHLIGLYKSIQDAVNNASCGYTIIVGDGEYTENVWIDKPITIRSENGSRNCIIKASNPYRDVFHVVADNVTITGFTIKGARNASGIHLFCAEYCNISNNIFLDNLYGLRLFQSDHNFIINNNYSNNIDGIYVEYYSIYNFIINNKLINNFCGIRFKDSYGNVVYLNEFINNKYNADANWTNIWNSTKPVKYIYNGSVRSGYLGNYWSDYRGNDTNNDGLGDSPYQINAKNIDYHPLIYKSSHYFYSSPVYPFKLFLSRIVNQILQQLQEGMPQSSEVKEQNLRITEQDRKKLEKLRDLLIASIKVYDEFLGRYEDDDCVKKQKEKLRILIVEVNRAIKSGQPSKNVSLLLNKLLNNNAKIKYIDELIKTLKSNNLNDKLKKLIEVYSIIFPNERDSMKLVVFRCILLGTREIYEDFNNLEKVKEIDQILEEIESAIQMEQIPGRENSKILKLPPKISKLLECLSEIDELGTILYKINSNNPSERLEGIMNFYEYSIDKGIEYIAEIIGVSSMESSAFTITILPAKLTVKTMFEICKNVLKELDENERLTKILLCVLCGIDKAKGYSHSYYCKCCEINSLSEVSEMFYKGKIFQIGYDGKHYLNISVYSNTTHWVILYGKMPKDSSFWTRMRLSYESSDVGGFISCPRYSDIPQYYRDFMNTKLPIDSVTFRLKAIYIGRYPIPIKGDTSIKDSNIRGLELVRLIYIPKQSFSNPKYLLNAEDMRLQVELRWDGNWFSYHKSVWEIDTKDGGLRLVEGPKTVNKIDEIMDAVNNIGKSISNAVNNAKKSLGSLGRWLKIPWVQHN